MVSDGGTFCGEVYPSQCTLYAYCINKLSEFPVHKSDSKE